MLESCSSGAGNSADLSDMAVDAPLCPGIPFDNVCRPNTPNCPIDAILVHGLQLANNGIRTARAESIYLCSSTWAGQFRAWTTRSRGQAIAIDSAIDS